MATKKVVNVFTDNIEALEDDIQKVKDFKEAMTKMSQFFVELKQLCDKYNVDVGNLLSNK